MNKWLELCSEEHVSTPSSHAEYIESDRGKPTISKMRFFDRCLILCIDLYKWIFEAPVNDLELVVKNHIYNILIKEKVVHKVKRLYCCSTSKMQNWLFEEIIVGKFITINARKHVKFPPQSTLCCFTFELLMFIAYYNGTL